MIPVVKILVKININGKTMDSSARSNILDEMPSGPFDFCWIKPTGLRYNIITCERNGKKSFVR